MTRLSIFFRYLILNIIFGSSFYSAHAEETDQKKIIQEYFSKVNQTEFFTARITHKRFSSLRKKWGSESSGKAEFAQPGLFRWAIEKPFEETTIFDGNKLYQWNGTDKKVQSLDSKNLLFSEIKKISSVALNPDKFIENYSIIHHKKISNEELSVSLKPKLENKEISQIILLIKKLNKQLYVAQTEIYYTNKNIWQIHFSEPSFKKIETSSFQVPK